MSEPTIKITKVDGTSEVYVLGVMLIHTKDSKGRPGICKYIPSDHRVELAGGEEFMIVFIPEKMAKE